MGDKAVLYSFGVLKAGVVESIAARAASITPSLEVVGRVLGSETEHPLFSEALDMARSLGATTILIPDDQALGSMSSIDFLRKVLPALRRDNLRVRAIRPPIFDTANEGFLYGISWASDSRKRKIAAGMAEWVGRKREAGEWLGRRPVCRGCGHPVVKVGAKTQGHPILADKSIGVCQHNPCGCPVYRPRSQGLMGVASHLRPSTVGGRPPSGRPPPTPEGPGGASEPRPPPSPAEAPARTSPEPPT